MSKTYSAGGRPRWQYPDAAEYGPEYHRFGARRMVVPTARFLILTESGVVSGILRLPLFQTDVASSTRIRDVTPPSLPPRAFIVGPENRLVCVAALSIQQCNSSSGRYPPYNPIYVYGPVGSGKTHFARGLAYSWQRSHPRQRIAILSASDFMRGDAENTQTTAREKTANWKDVAFLALDDVHQLGRKQSSQLRLAELIDEFLADGRPIVITGKWLPRADHHLIPYLSSRLLTGLTVPVHLPAMEARAEILKQLLLPYGLQWSNAALRTAASQLSGTATQLRAALSEFLAARKSKYSTISHLESEFQRVLVGTTASVVPSMREVVRLVARHFQITVSSITGPSRRQTTVQARMVAIYLIRQLTHHSFKQIGRHFGKRDHTTIIHAYRKMQTWLQNDPAILPTINELRFQLT